MIDGDLTGGNESEELLEDCVDRLESNVAKVEKDLQALERKFHSLDGKLEGLKLLISDKLEGEE